MIRKFFTRLETFLRSLFIEASFNYESMQTWGVLFTMLPFLRQQKFDADYIREFEIRHKVFINTHPFLASFLLGAVLKMEEEHTDIKKETGVSIDKFKSILSQSLAVSGDRFFWKYLKPICAVFGVLLIVSNNFAPFSVLAGTILFLLFFNIPSIIIRAVGFYIGFRVSKNILHTKVMKKLEGWNYYLSISGLFLVGLLVVIEANYVYLEKDTGLVAFLVSFLISFYLNLKRKFPSTAIYITLICSIGIYYIFESI